MAIFLERLADTAANRQRVQAVLAAAPRFAWLTEGHAPPANAGDEVFTSVAPGGSIRNKSVFAICEHCEGGHTTVGVIDVYRQWNAINKVMIGLLLLAEHAQGRGLGSQAFVQVMDEMRTWDGFDTVRIGIIQNNQNAFVFWRKHGFNETGEVKHSDAFVAPVVILERPLQSP